MVGRDVGAVGEYDNGLGSREVEDPWDGEAAVGGDRRLEADRGPSVVGEPLWWR